MKSLIIGITLLLLGASATAEDLYNPLYVGNPALNDYMVSAVLKKNGEETTIRLVHAIETGINEDAAFGAFTRHVLSQFKGYSLADSIIVMVPKKTAPCEVKI